MMPQLPVNEAFARLSVHAKIHEKLDALSHRQRDLLLRIEEREILAYNDPARYAKLEALKAELLSIQFLEEELTNPSP